ncbi:hypothetical protein ACIBCA_31590 [Kitasatospora sp. NPDC051170]|uniref:hypothetical protein n=1 Tax=Kitasatospora sp. NPDC051170 TaxID=3364056 RepID=UPI0037BA694E
MDPTIDPVKLKAAAHPETLGAYLAALPQPPMHMGHAPVTSVRTAEFRGHRISVTTSYEITVDGKRVDAGMDVDNSGMLSCHGLPAYQFLSAVDAVRVLINTYPDAFKAGG